MSLLVNVFPSLPSSLLPCAWDIVAVSPPSWLFISLMSSLQLVPTLSKII